MPERAADLQAGHIRRREVDNDKVERRFFGLPQRCFAVADRVAAIAIEREMRADGLAQAGFVFDEENAFRRSGSGGINRAGRGCKGQAIKTA